MRMIGHILIILTLILSGFVLELSICPVKVSAYTPHDPIYIDSDDDFAIQAANEGWPGDGSEDNPYIIEGYEITVDDTYPWYYSAIDIASTEVHFVVRNSRIIAGIAHHLIYLNGVDNGTIQNCIIENGSLGIYIWAGRQNTITNNTFINNNLFVSESIECTFRANKFIEGGFEFMGFFSNRYCSHNIDLSNTVNGKPVYYWKYRNGETVPMGAGQVILAGCTQVTIENQELSNGSIGIILGYSSFNNIQNNVIHSNNEKGLDIWHSSDNTITENNISSNGRGFWIQSSNNNSIQFNEVKSNGNGIFLSNSNGNYIFFNNVSSNYNGIEISSAGEGRFISKSNIIANNTFMDNQRHGLSMENSDENTIRNNIAINNSAGFYLISSDRNKIIGNIARNNRRGVQLEDFSNRSSIISNNISNNYYGIHIRSSYNNIFHHNNLINNLFQLDQNNSVNSWDDGKGEGNYWSDYGGIDLDGDGVGETDLPHFNVDDYPLMESVDIFNYKEDEEEKSHISYVTWILSFIWLVVIAIIVLLTLLTKKRKPPVNPPESESQIDLPIQPKF